jgi:RND family efflux transporter MFP subunit
VKPQAQHKYHRIFFLAGFLLAILTLPRLALRLSAQGAQPSLIQYTAAIEHRLRSRINLLGTVEARTLSIVASEIAGKVSDLPVREGQSVEADAVLARLSTTALEHDLAALEAELKEALARSKLAETNLARARELFEALVISRQQLDNAVTEYDATGGRVEKLEADIARLRHDISQATIRAPFAGRIVQKRTEVGQWVSEGGPVVEILALDPLDVTVPVPERFYQNLRVGSPAQVRFEAVPNLEINGRVSAIVPQAHPESRTYPVKVEIRNLRGRVAVGMLAQVTFTAGELYGATLVPKDAVISRGAEKFVFRVQGQGSTVEQIPVQVGQGVRDWIEVQGGIRPGDRVVIRGNERLFPGQPVQAQPLEYRKP